MMDKEKCMNPLTAELKLNKKEFKQLLYLLIAVILLLLTLKCSFLSSLDPIGRSMLSILVFALFLWVTEAVGFAESSIYVIAAMSLVLAVTPDPAAADKLIGLKQGMAMAMSGLSSDAWIMVVAAFFIAAAVNITGLGERIGLTVLHLIGSEAKQIIISAKWMANNTLIALGVQNLNFSLMILATGLIFGLFALAFSSRAAAAAAIIPTAIGFIQSVGGAQIHSWGFAIMVYYVVQTVAVLPMNHPMAMLAYSSKTFSSGEMLKLGIPFMIIELILLALLASTYWKLVGLT